MGWWFGSLTFLCLVVGAGLAVYWIRRIRAALASGEEFARTLLQTQEKERKRIAAELHDSIGQNLLIIRSRSELGLRAAPAAAEMEEQLKEISQIASMALEEARRISHNVGPHYLEQLGLTEALDAMIDRVAASTEVQFERKLEVIDDLFEAESATNLYRMTQEALNNVMKHAKATTARVEVIRDLHHVQLLVQDNGQGFDATQCRRTGQGRNGVGLSHLRERARLMGGKIEIVSSPGRGTELTVTIPIPDGKKL